MFVARDARRLDDDRDGGLDGGEVGRFSRLEHDDVPRDEDAAVHDDAAGGDERDLPRDAMDVRRLGVARRVVLAGHFECPGPETGRLEVAGNPPPRHVRETAERHAATPAASSTMARWTDAGKSVQMADTPQRANSRQRSRVRSNGAPCRSGATAYTACPAARMRRMSVSVAQRRSNSSSQITDAGVIVSARSSRSARSLTRAAIRTVA